MAFFKKLASPFKGKAAREEEKLGIAEFKRQEEERLSAARANLQAGRRESHSMSSLSSQAQRAHIAPAASNSGNLSYVANPAIHAPQTPRRQISDGNLSYHGTGPGAPPVPSPKLTPWKKLKETFRMKPPTPKKGSAEATAAATADQAALQAQQQSLGSRPASILGPVGPLAGNLQRQSSGPSQASPRGPSQASPRGPSPQPSLPTQLQLSQASRVQAPWQQQQLPQQQMLQRPPQASSPRQGPVHGVVQQPQQGMLPMQQRNIMQQGMPQQPIAPQLQGMPQQGIPGLQGVHMVPSATNLQANSQAAQATQAQLRDLQHKLSVKESELQEMGRLKHSLAQEQNSAIEWKEKWNTQNFKLNLMVDMLALNLAEKEYPQGKGASTVGLLSRPAPKLGMAV
uniref:Uncharacterized protein n=1 Tax=Dunaliella tertiolecta TaxID=3047 RepID=A0A7S3R063_DUNTE